MEGGDLDGVLVRRRRPGARWPPASWRRPAPERRRGRGPRTRGPGARAGPVLGGRSRVLAAGGVGSARRRASATEVGEHGGVRLAAQAAQDARPTAGPVEERPAAPQRGGGCRPGRAPRSMRRVWALVRTSTAWRRPRPARAVALADGPGDGRGPRRPRRRRRATVGHRPVRPVGRRAALVLEHGGGDGQDLGRRAVVVRRCRTATTGVALGGEVRPRSGRGSGRRRRSSRRWPGSGRRRRTGRRRSPSHARSRRYWSGFTSWNSSTKRWRKRQRWAAANGAVLARWPQRAAASRSSKSTTRRCASRPRT